MRAPARAMPGEPGLRRLFDHVAAFPQRGIGLRLQLQHIAPVGEHGGAVGQHGGEAGAAGKSGQPGQALGGGGDIFAEMLVGARDDETVHAPAVEFGAEGGKARVMHGPALSMWQFSAAWRSTVGTAARFAKKHAGFAELAMIPLQGRLYSLQQKPRDEVHRGTTPATAQIWGP